MKALQTMKKFIEAKKYAVLRAETKAKFSFSSDNSDGGSFYKDSISDREELYNTCCCFIFFSESNSLLPKCGTYLFKEKNSIGHPFPEKKKAGKAGHGDEELRKRETNRK